MNLKTQNSTKCNQAANYVQVNISLSGKMSRNGYLEERLNKFITCRFPQLLSHLMNKENKREKKRKKLQARIICIGTFSFNSFK